MRRLVAAAGLAALLFLVAVAADRIAAGYVAEEVEQQLATQGFDLPEVTIRGFPFATQAASRHYRLVEVRARAVAGELGRAEQVRAVLEDVRVDRLGVPQGGRVGAFRARATVPYGEVVKAADIEDLRLAMAPGGEVRLAAAVELLGNTVEVAARGRVEARGDHLRLVPTDFEVEGLGDLDDRLSALLTERFGLEYPNPGLPPGVAVRSVTAAANGFVIDVGGHDTTLRAG